MSHSSQQARFTQGSTMRHVMEMTVTGSIGLIAIFFVDFLSLFYISRLNDDALTAGVGYATTVLFLSISVNIGTMIAGTALVARQIGAGGREAARNLAGTTLALAVAVALGISLLLLATLEPLLTLLGATGMPREVATRFLWITLPVNALFAFGITLSGFLRAVGDARRAMFVTLIGGAVTAITDPLLIFGAGLGTDGAAIATVITRFIYAGVGFYGVHHIHRLLAWPSLKTIRADMKPFFGIALPAILTNVATPVANLLVLKVLAQFGPAAIAANAILDRLVPLAFGVLFALSGAVGPILAQNLGAKRYDRVRMGLRDSLIFAMGYSLLAWILLILLREPITHLFAVEGDTARYVIFFCLVGGLGWMFNGGLFVANAAFNNLGFPLYSTLFNWGRATLGTLPFAWGGAYLAEVEGAMAGVVIGSAIFGLASILVAFRAIGKLEARDRLAAAPASA